MKKVFIRTDGNEVMGLGHIIRTCALAEMLRTEFAVTFFITNPSEYIKKEVAKTGSSLVPVMAANDVNEEAERWATTLTGDEIVVLDGYHFTTSYQEAIKASGCKLVCVDDIHAYHFVADVVINHAGGVAASMYSVEKYTELCLGFEYALLRPSFLQAVKSRVTKMQNAESVFVCLGGADLHNQTGEVVQAVAAKYPAFCYNVVIGGAYLHKEALLQQLADAGINFTMHEKLSAEELLGLMQSSSKAICSPSSVSIEYLTTGGDLYLLMIAPNQKAICQYYLNTKLGFPISDFLQPSEAFNKELQMQIFDGSQDQRLLKVFNKLR